MQYKIICRTDKLNKNGEAPLYLQFYHDGRRKKIVVSLTTFDILRKYFCRKIGKSMIMKNEQYPRLREQVQKIEEKILAIMGKNVEFNMEWTRSQRKCEQVERLIWKRKHLLDKMFVATP